MATKNFNDEERIRRNYCGHYIAHMLLYRFSMEKIRKIALKQGMHRTKGWENRHVDEFNWFQEKIYNAMDEKLKNIIAKEEMRLYAPYGSINLSNEEIEYSNKFEEILYNIVK